LPKPKELSFDEIIRIVRIFGSLGGKYIRLTGGEPLVRDDVVDLVKEIKKVRGIKEVCLTTNGVLLSRYAKELKRAGLNRINISLDSLKREQFTSITGKNCLENVIDGIELVNQLGFQKTKLNMVVMKGVNDDEIQPFIEFAKKKRLILRFIEFMKVTALWDEKYFISQEDILNICNAQYRFNKTEEKGPGPAEYYRNNDQLIGFIRTSYENCKQCSRLRVTSDGKLKLCLYEKEGVDLSGLLKEHDCGRTIKNIFKITFENKKRISFRDFKEQELFMSNIGG